MHWGVNNIWAVAVPDLGTLECRFKGKRLSDVEDTYNPLAPGDYVEVEPDGGHPGKGMILSRYERKNAYSRWNIKRQVPQAFAANLDLLVVLTTPSHPPFRPRFLDRAVVLAQSAGIPVAIFCNKVDLGLDEVTEDRLAWFQDLGCEVLTCSASSGEGMEEVRSFLTGKTAAFVGQSGVGKSSVFNALVPGGRQRVGEISSKHDRGSHTTNYSFLVPWEGGSLIDTPGIRDLEVFGLEPEELPFYFPEFEKYSGKCSFQPCSHRHEPGCKVLEAVKKGKILEDRWESYGRIREELEARKTY